MYEQDLVMWLTQSSELLIWVTHLTVIVSGQRMDVVFVYNKKTNHGPQYGLCEKAENMKMFDINKMI